MPLYPKLYSIASAILGDSAGDAADAVIFRALGSHTPSMPPAGLRERILDATVRAPRRRPFPRLKIFLAEVPQEGKESGSLGNLLIVSVEKNSYEMVFVKGTIDLDAIMKAAEEDDDKSKK